MAGELKNTQSILKTSGGDYRIYRLDALEQQGLGTLDRLPFSIRIILEAVLRHHLHGEATQDDVANLARWKTSDSNRPTMPYYPGRVIMQDFTGVPVVVDLASMRSAMQKLKSDPARINPVIPVDLVIDHSVQVDYFGTQDALNRNASLEFERNRERYEFLHWAQNAFQNFQVVPPATGIVHQVNLEYLTHVVLTLPEPDGATVAFPDTLVGTDSHTTMINGLGVVGFGVGGIEAIAAMLAQPIEMLIPDVIGFKLSGKLPEGVTPTDLTLTITQMLRKKGVVDKFVEFFGPGLSNLAVTDRAMIANMSPENGATITFFPVDEQTLSYMRLTGREEGLVSLVEAYCKEQHLFRTDATLPPKFTDVLELDLGSIEPSLAGPKRPQDRVTLANMKTSFEQALTRPKAEGGYALDQQAVSQTATFELDGGAAEMRQGAVAIAAITSCTNTSNPYVMVGAGLLAKKAVEKGLKVKPYVKTSMAPGSRVVTDYLEQAGLMRPLEALGFDLVGYGCTTCIGNSGPLPEEVAKTIQDHSLVAASVLSGNRNFEGRINPNTLANYLASPPLVVAYALAGTVDIDLTHEPIGVGKDGQEVYLKDIWPTSQEILDTVSSSIRSEMFKDNYAEVLTGNQTWNDIHSGSDEIFHWNPDSTYIQEPPYFEGFDPRGSAIQDIMNARVLALLGDSITTDHISPAGAIPVKGAAGQYLISKGVEIRDFNSFGSRRGNDRVMTRGTFGNIRLKNQLVPGVEGSFTAHLPEGTQMSIFDAAMKYREENVPLLVIAGKEYGTGSSRDWAAKGTMLLGVRAVIAESFERIHRSNLAGMGILPLQYKPGQNAQSLGLTGKETFSIRNLADRLAIGAEIPIDMVCEDGREFEFKAIIRLNTAKEIQYYHDGGVLQTVLKHFLKAQ